MKRKEFIQRALAGAGLTAFKPLAWLGIDGTTEIFEQPGAKCANIPPLTEVPQCQAGIQEVWLAPMNDLELVFEEPVQFMNGGQIQVRELNGSTTFYRFELEEPVELVNEQTITLHMEMGEEQKVLMEIMSERSGVAICKTVEGTILAEPPADFTL